MWALWPIRAFKSRGYEINRHPAGRSRIIRASLPPRSPVCAPRFYGGRSPIFPTRPLLQTDRKSAFRVFDPTTKAHASAGPRLLGGSALVLIDMSFDQLGLSAELL